MRQIVRNALIGNAGLTAIVPAARWYAAGAVIDRPVFPFVVLRWLAPVPSSAIGKHLHQLRVDVHDKRGSYKQIEDLLGNQYAGGGIFAVLSGLLDVSGPDGRVTECTYLNHSGDQEDPNYSSNFKFSSWQVIGVQS